MKIMNASKNSFANDSEKWIELPPIKESSEDYDALEKRMKELFKRLIYIPLLKELNRPSTLLKNAKPNPLVDALFKGRVTYHDGVFSGQLNAGVSKELKALGAKFDRKTGTFKIGLASLPMDVKNVIAASEGHFQKTISKLQDKLAKIVPEELAEQLKASDIFDRTLWKTDQEFKKNVKNIAVSPQLTPEARKRIADEWQNNMRLYIKDFTQKEIKELRGKIQENVFTGNRYGNMVKTIQDSYGVSARKAKFLASQESRLLLTKHKEVKYQEAGVHQYVWRTVHRPKDASPDHHVPGNVRYAHGLLDGKIFRFDTPPITTNPGETVRRNNPGEDFNCRCFLRAIIRK